MKEKKQWSIFEIHSKLYVTENESGELYRASKNERLLIYDETEAENLLLKLNDERDGCYVLIDETL